MSKRGKRIKQVGALALTAAVLLTTIYSDADRSVFAQELFTGINSVIENHGSSDEPFVIAELVPDLSYAKLGYMVEGSEPYSFDAESNEILAFDETLANIEGVDQRKQYISNLLNDLGNMVGNQATNALSYSEYDEKYASEDGYEKVVLNSNELVTLDKLDGYEFVDDDNGSYIISSSYTPVIDGTGAYNQNIISFSTKNSSNKYYNVIFELIETQPEDEPGTQPEDEPGTQPEDESGTQSEEEPATQSEEAPEQTASVVARNSQLVSVPNTGAYKVDTTKTEVVSFESADQFESYSASKLYSYYNHSFHYVDNKTAVFTGETYYKVVFEYVQNPTGEEDNYYKVSGWEFSYDPVQAIGTGEYGATLDITQPYIQVSEGENGYFNSNGDDIYTYAGTGYGNYTLQINPDGVVNKNVEIGEIFYKGGFTNNNILKEGVFNQNGKLTADEDVYVKVIPMTPEMLEDYGYSDIDLIYISDSALGTTDLAKNYSADNDISDKLAYNLYYYASSNSRCLPVILEDSLMTNLANQTDLNIYKLAQLLESEDYTEYLLPEDGENDGSYVSFDQTASEWTVPATITAFVDNDAATQGYKHYVNRNVYVVPGIRNTTVDWFSSFLTVFLNGTGTEDAFKTSADGMGFYEIANTIVTENFYRETENEAITNPDEQYGYFDMKISNAIAVEYIISFLSRREEYQADTLEILDIEPCMYSNTSTYTYYDNWQRKYITEPGSTAPEVEARIRSYFNVAANVTINITHVTSSEFIGRTEDIMKYDAIYLGLQTDVMNKATYNGEADRVNYNDDSMDGLVYTNIGDLANDKWAAGKLDTDYSSTSTRNEVTNSTYEKARYSGNDITNEKVTAITNFVKAGSPVILANNFLLTRNGTKYLYDHPFTNSTSTTKNTSINGYIDNCSHMAELILAIKDSPNVMTESELSSESKKTLLTKYATLGKPKLTITTSVNTATGCVTMTDNVVRLDFRVTNYGSADANASFDCVVYADYNADGRYSNKTENLEANDYVISLNGSDQAIIPNARTDDDNNLIYYYQLSSNETNDYYHLEYTLNDDFAGVLPLKIQINQNGNPYRYDYDVLYFRRSSGNNKNNLPTINVLQITGSSQSGSATDLTFDMTSADFRNNYLSKLDVNVNTSKMTAKEFYNAYGKYYNTASASTKAKELIENYQMLVIGFADSYYWPGDGNSDSARETSRRNYTVANYYFIHEYIESGNSVLFTHDTTDYNSNPNFTTMKNTGNDVMTWGYYLSEYLVPDVGMDRYGLYSEYGSNAKKLVAAGIDGITKNSSASINGSSYYSLDKNYTQGELFTAIENAAGNDYDIAYKPNSDKTKLVNNVQSRSSGTLNADRADTSWLYDTVSSVSGTTSTRYNLTGYPNVGSYSQVSTSNTSSNAKIKMINEGQILLYPFNLTTSLDQYGEQSIAPTHNQYFQLNLNGDADNDGQSDMTVWFTLGGNTYDIALGDVRNNYYIYTKGNITYSGVGHRSISSSSYEFEKKLYANTVAVAINAGIRNTAVSIKENANKLSADLNVIYESMDAVINAETGAVANTGNGGKTLDTGTQQIYFFANDTNNTEGGDRVMSVKYYKVFKTQAAANASLAKNAANAYIEGATVVNLGTDSSPAYAIELNLKTYTGVKDSNVEITTSKTRGGKDTQLINGLMYSAYVPYALLEDAEDTAEIRVVVNTQLFKQNVRTAYSDKSGYDSILLERVSLFDLD